MAITGTFVADFDSFHAAVQAAEVKLRSFEAGAAKVGTALNRMADSFSGRKVIQDAELMVRAVEKIGGVSKLTATELQRVSAMAGEAAAKMKAMGIEVPPGLQRIANEARTASGIFGNMRSAVTSLAGAFGVVFSIGAVVNFGRSLLETADELVKVSDRTGLLIEDVQRLGYVGAQSGNSLDSLTGAIGKMQLNLNDPKAQQAFRNLNLNLAELVSARPYEQFELIAEAVGRLPDPTLQAEAAVAIFGRTGLEILPTLKAKFKELADEVTVSSTAEVKALEAAGDALNRMKTNATNWATSTLGSFALVAEQVGVLNAVLLLRHPLVFTDVLESAQEAAAAVTDVALAVPPVVSALDAYRAHLDAARVSVSELSSAEQELIRDALALGESTSAIAAAMNLTVGTVDTYADSLRKAAEAAKKLDADAKAAARVEAQGLLEVTKLWAEFNDLRSSQSGTTTDKLIADIERWYAVTVAAAQKAGTDTKEFYEALEALSQEKLNNLAVIDPEGKSRESLKLLADVALAEFDRMRFSGLTYSREVLDAQLQKYRDAMTAVREYGTAAVGAHTSAAEAAKTELTEVEKLKAASAAATQKFTTSFESAEEVMAATGLSGFVRDQLIANLAAPAGAATPPAGAIRVPAPGVASPGLGRPAIVNTFNLNGITTPNVAKLVEQELVKNATMKRLLS